MPSPRIDNLAEHRDIGSVIAVATYSAIQKSVPGRTAYLMVTATDP